jgi:hypothetical protein
MGVREQKRLNTTAVDEPNIFNVNLSLLSVVLQTYAAILVL